MKYGIYHPGEPGDGITGIESKYGWTPAVINIFRGFGTSELLYSSEIDTLHRHLDVTPMVTWEPDESSTQTMTEIVNGEHDLTLLDGARAIERYGRPVLVRFAHEMNGVWYHWGDDPDLYREAWARVTYALRANTIWSRMVWCPNGLGDHSPELRPWYPGDKLVNWLSFDAYNDGRWGWKSPYETYHPTYLALNQINRFKPIIIAETACGTREGRSKAEWIRNLPRAMERMRGVRHLCWFDKDMRPDKPDWRIDSSRATLEAWRSIT